MTDQQQGDDTAQLAPRDGNAAPADQEVTEREQPERDSPNHEAARYRRQLRDTEAERDGLAARVERLQRAEIVRMVGDRLAQPDDLLAFGVGLADLLTDDGDVDPGLVETALYGVLTARPGLAPAPEPPGFPDLGGGRRGTTVETGPGWSELLRPRR